MAQYDITMRDYWRIVRKRKIIVIFATIMLGLSSFASALISKPAPRYRTTAKVQYEKAQTAEEAYVQALGGGDNLETQQSVITSYPVVERAAHRLGYVDTTTATDEERIEAILSLRSKISTDTEGLTNIISLTVTHGDAYEARDIANILAQEYIDYNFASRNAMILQTRKFIKAQRDTVEARLKAAQENLKIFQEQTQIISIESQTNRVLSRLQSTQNGLEQLQTVRNNIDQLLREYRESGSVSENILSVIPPEEAGSTFNRLNAALQTLNEQRDRLLIDYTEEHPQVVDFDQRKKVLLEQMLFALRTQREILSRRVENQQKAAEQLGAEYQRLPQMGIQLDELQRDVKVQGELLSFYEERYQESRIAQTEEVREVTLLQKALLPKSPINASTPSTTAGAGAVLGLILGLVFAFIAETLDTSIGTIEDVEEYLEVPVVGIIPHIDIEDIKEALVRNGVPTDDNETLERRLRLAAHFEPRSTLAESYRALRTNIQFANLEKGAKTISVTSSAHQEGKSTTISNLAMTLAQAGNRVLLVDADLRRPTISRIFGLEREPGLTDAILGNYSWREVVRTVTDIMVGGLGMEDIMMTPGMDNLNIITSGVIPPNPAEITDSRRMSEFIEEVKTVYDVILFDSPPILQATDATVMGTKVDGVLLVYKIGNVSRSALRRAKLQLDTVRATVLGIVINGLRAEVNSEDFRDLRYYSYYSYGSDLADETGPLHKRIYNRTVRRLKFYREMARKYEEILHTAAREKLGRYWPEFLDRVRAHLLGEDTSTREDEPEGIHGRILRILFWAFLVLFLTAGILWQLDLIKPVYAPRSTEQPVLETPGLPPTQPDAQNPDDPQTPPAQAKPQPQPESPRPAPPKETPASPDGNASHQDARPRKQPEVLPRTDRMVRTASAERPAGDSRSPAEFAVHISSHKIRASAEREARLYEKKGHPVRLVQITIPGRGLFYRLLVGRYETRAEADRAAQIFKGPRATGYAAVVPLPALDRPEPDPQSGAYLALERP